MVIQLNEQPADCLVETIGENVIPVMITESQIGKGEVEMGDSEVECRIGPRVGGDMRAFKFQIHRLQRASSVNQRYGWSLLSYRGMKLAASYLSPLPLYLTR